MIEKLSIPALEIYNSNKTKDQKISDVKKSDLSNDEKFILITLLSKNG